MSILLIMLLSACSTEAPVAPPTPAPVATPTPAPVVAVGPDGPASIKVPVLTLPSDPTAVAAGEKVFAARGCGSCHQFGSKLVGPDLLGVLTRRSLLWTEKMIMAPDVMIKEDPVAKDLYRSMMTPMPKQGVTEEELPNLLAFIKSKGG